MKVGEHRIVCLSVDDRDAEEGCVQSVYVEFYAQVNEREFATLSDMLETGHLLNGVEKS